MTVPTLDGKNLYQWRAEYNELVTQFINYAEHQSGCRPDFEHAHKHNTPIDNRIVCDAQPCTCGLVDKLHALIPTVEFTIPCPDKTHLKLVIEYEHCVWNDASKCAQRMASIGQGFRPCAQKHLNEDVPNLD